MNHPFSSEQVRAVLDLSGEFELFSDDAPEHAPDPVAGRRLTAQVPGDIHLDLQRAAVIDDPFYDLNFQACRWVAERDWTYRKAFTVDDAFINDRVDLVFEGIDTAADVYLNDTHVAYVENMFTIWRFDVTHLVRPGANTLMVKMRAIARLARERQTGEETAYACKGRVHIRKAQMSFGWDNVPEILTTGIYRPVYLESFAAARIADVCVKNLELQADAARLRIETHLETLGPDPLVLTYSLSLNGESVAWHNREVSGDWDTFEFAVPSPQLWWPHTLGEPVLYDLDVALSDGSAVLDAAYQAVGIRTVEVIEEEQPGDATSFIFAVNGKRLFVYGANWQPLNAFTSQVTDLKYQAVLAMAKDAGFNMFRVWGGGIVERDVFYDLCDRLGILIWQDFFFACALYPTDQAFLDEVVREERQIITRLRNHPAIALWCGDNEIDMIYHHRKPDNYKELNKISYELTGPLLDELDGNRFYLPSSPSSKVGLPINPKSRNMHNWDFWHGKKHHKEFAKDESRFLSEFGRYAAPRFEHLAAFIPPEKRWPFENESYAYHSGILSMEPHHPDYANALKAMLKGFGEPKDAEEFVRLTQISQAEFYSFAYAHLRSRKYECGGGIMWKLADAWPCLCNSVIDFWGCPKPGFYALKRMFRPVSAFFTEAEQAVSVHLSNDLARPVQARIVLQHLRLDGDVLWREEFDASCPAGAVAVVHTIDLGALDITDPAREALFLLAYDEDGGEIARAPHFFLDLEAVRFAPNDVTVDYGEQTATVTAQSYARFIELESRPYEVWEDNYFDLLPGETRVVRKAIY